MSVKVDDILQFKSQTNKRRSDDSDENSAPSSKISRSDSISNAEDVEKLLKVIDEQDVEILDERGVKKLIVNFEKRALKNQEMRIKFPDQPEKFMESEVDLNVAIQELHAVATVPHLYNIFIELNVVENFIQMMNHENTDISCAVVHLLQELTDVDTLNESEEGATTLISSLIDAQIVGVLVKNLERLDETNKDEADGVYNTLAVVENIAEFRPEICINCVQQGFLAWLIKRLKSKTPVVDANRMYCAEILAVLLQNSDECKRTLADLDGIDVLLQQLASYKRHNPSSVDEVEYMENLFNCLCAALMEKANLKKFLDGEGLQLMNLMLREKKMSRESALKVLDYATTGETAKDNCDKFVDILGLRTLFPLFMKTPSKNKRKGRSAEEHEEHVCAVVASLLKHCGATQRQRIFSKFVESDHEKVERLIELHFRYLELVQNFEKESSTRKKRGGDDDDEDEEDIYIKKLDSGLFTLQLIDYILAEIVVNGSPTIRERVGRMMNMKKSSLKTVSKVLREYAESIGGDDKNDEKNKLLALLDKL